MESIFNRGTTAHVPTIFERIGPEIQHLERAATARDGSQTSKMGAWTASIALFFLLALFVMDPFLYAMHKSHAIHAYLYLHNYDSASATQSLANSGIFTQGEITVLNTQDGSYQNSFASPEQAEETAASVVEFMKGLHALHYGEYAQLDPIGKLRYLLFVRIGLYPPTAWSGLNPSVY